ncbi:DUF1772 domain-containing protein [Amycolatopsis antarctica]|uniref:DUF1772 domain-containing protein n=1 Tax=Amycolatopsis antarctica TaxID=1854586 RepID=A0A263D238_9PSEU|nr:DUF1772 domain-containing protein [Amycolatopsis antarctica]OZM72534.1 DUF1772 domain-containing protein [Amycolatopsis antarctica]
MRARTRRLLTAARIGQAHWFFGNLYEAVVRLPDSLARADPKPSSPFAKGSPVRYYLPAAPVTVAVTLAATVTGWDVPADRPRLATSAGATVTGALLTAYLVRAVNLRLFVAGPPVSEAERDALLRRWYRLNAVRLLAAGGALAVNRNSR